MILKILDKKLETANVFSLVLEKPKDFSFYPGQYLDVNLPVNDPYGDTRAFTISSSPTEDFLMITPKKGISPFKKFMEDLKPGDQITTSHPAGTFTLDESSPAAFLAGGIGITPARSMVKYAVDQKLKTPISLIYSNSTNNFLFKEELDKWRRGLNLKIDYVNTSVDGRVNIHTIQNTIYDIPNTIFYLAGSHSFVNNIAQILVDSGVDETNIRYDRFDGYA